MNTFMKYMKFTVFVVAMAIVLGLVNSRVIMNYFAPKDSWHCVGQLVGSETRARYGVFDVVIEIGTREQTMTVVPQSGGAFELDTVGADRERTFGWSTDANVRYVWSLYRATGKLKVLPYEGNHAEVDAQCTMKESAN